MRATIHEVKKRNFTWIGVLVLLIVPIIVEILWGENLYNLTHNHIISSQSFMLNLTKLRAYNATDEDIQYNSENETKPNSTQLLLSYLDESSENNKSNVTEVFMTEFIHIINSNGFYIFLCSILYNFINIYKIFILYMTIFIANFVSSTLSYIFQFPKPYMAFFKIKSVAFFNEWGSPNNQIIVLISFACSFYKVVVSNRTCCKTLAAKIIVILILIIYSFIDGFLLFSSGNITYNQLIISACLSVAIFLFIFYCFPLDLNNSKQFYDFMKFKFYYWIFINILIFVLEILLSIFITDRRNTQYYDKNVQIQAERLGQTEFSRDYCKYRTLFTLNNGNFCNVISFLMNMVAFFAVKADIRFIYGNNYNSWSEGNFEDQRVGPGIIDGDHGGLIEYNNLDKTQWNHNKGSIVFARTLLDIIFHAIIFGFFIWVTHFTKNEILLFIFLVAFPMIFSVFGNLFFFKALYIKMNLARKPKIRMKNILY